MDLVASIKIKGDLIISYQYAEGDKIDINYYSKSDRDESFEKLWDYLKE